ncbi:hypothetical protein Fcan01_17028 [Folsomia candida]|uniref:Uncharacterized protein n=1 Tax=Folsomia candida TaxID=158441 RepID=A0A226DSA9_FOLCA|nr:hypothetical protein Fcan01_17028 [Folsomia candida]
MWGNIRQDVQKNANKILRLGHKLSIGDLLWELFDSDVAMEIGLLSIGIGKEAGNLSFIFNEQYDNESSCGEVKMFERMPVFSVWEDKFLLSKGSRETLSFVTCGGSSTSSVNFSGFISSFDVSTWISILTSILTFALFFTSIYTLRSKSPLTGLRISVELSVRALLEQGDHITESSKRFQTFINYIFCPWILTAIVLTNAYKGKNITDLTSPLRLEGITKFSQFKTHPINFTIYTMNTAFMERTSREDCGSVEHVRDNDYRNEDKYLLTLFKPEFRELFRDYFYDKVQVYPDCHLFRFSNFTFFNVLKNCDENVAAFVWSSEADEIVAKLKQYLGRRGKLKISRGEEPLIFRNKGWKLRGPGRIIPIVKRLTALKEAGVVDELRRLGRIRRERMDGMKEFGGNEANMKGLSIRGNIGAVFALWGICLVGLVLMGVMEGRHVLLWGGIKTVQHYPPKILTFNKMKLLLNFLAFISPTLLFSSASEMTKFSDVVTVFESCLVEIINYEGVNLVQNSDVKVPFILIRSVILTLNRNNGKNIFYMFYPYEYASRPEREAFNTTEVWNPPTPYNDISTRTKHQWKCFARLFLLPPMPDLEMRSEFSERRDSSKFYYMSDRDHVKCGDWTDLDLEQIRYSQGHWNEYPVTALDYPFRTSAPKYYVLLRRTVKYKWEYAFSSFWEAFALDNQITGVVITLTHSLDEIKSTELLCTNCPAIKKTALKFIPGVKFNIERLQCRNDLDCSSEIPIRLRMWGKIREDLYPHANRILRLGYKLSLVDLLWELFDSDIAMEIGLLSIGVGKEARNLSFIFDEQYDNDSSCGEVEMFERMPVFLVWEDNFLLSKGSRETLTFVTCGGTSTSSVNFSGFISCFDFYTWISLLTSIFTFSSFLLITYTIRSKAPLIGVQISLEVSIRALLEQGEHTSKKSQTFLSYLFGPWILITIVLTNAYKGKNITDLTSPLHLEGISTFPQFKTHPVNFTIYTQNTAFMERKSREDCEDDDHARFETRYAPMAMFEQLTVKDQFGEFHRIVAEFYTSNFQTEVNDILPLLKPELRELFRYYFYDKVQVYPDCHLFRFSNFTFFNVLKNCDENVAAFVWSSEADEIEAKLKRYLGRRGKLKISRGEEPLIFKRKGWKLRGPGRIVPIIDRLTALKEAGVVDELRKLGKLRGLRMDEIEEFGGNEDDLKGLSIRGNIGAVFALWGICLVGSVVMGVAEGRNVLLRGGIRFGIFILKVGRKGFSWLGKRFGGERFLVKEGTKR